MPTSSVGHNACMQSYVPNCSQCFWDLLLQGERSSQFGQILVFFPSSVQRSRLVFLVTIGSSKTQWWIHEGPPKGCRAAKIQSRTEDRRESPRVPQHARDHVLHFTGQVVLPGPTCERTCRHPVKLVECELSAPLGHPGQTRFGAALDRSTSHVSVPWPPDRQCDGLGGIHCTIPSSLAATGAQLDSHVISPG